MESGIPQHHPLRRLFNALTERSFSEKLGWPDLNITQYVANLLVEFTHTNQLYKVRNQRDQRVDTVIDLLYESEVLLGAQSWIASGMCISISETSRSSWPVCFPNI